MSRPPDTSAEPSLILLTDFPATARGGGAVILRSLLDEELTRRVVWVTLTPEGEGPTDPSVAGRTVALNGGVKKTSPRTSRSLVMDSTLLSRKLAEEVRQIARAHRAAGYWAVMHGAVVSIASHLAGWGDIPLVATVHDDPAFGVALRSRRYLPLVPLIERDFARTLRRAAAVEVISRGMKERYLRRYGVECFLGNRLLPAPATAPSPFCKGGRALSIGVLGNTYAYSSLLSLGLAVAAASEGLGLSGELLIVGQCESDRLKRDLGDRVSIRAVGHVEESEATRLLRGTFLQYLNYPFGRRDRVLRQTSFPSKLATYISAGRPLLLHTPGDSSTAELARIPGLAFHWDRPDWERGAAVLRQAWLDPRTSDDARAPLEAVRRRYYEFDEIKSKLHDLIKRA